MQLRETNRGCSQTGAQLSVLPQHLRHKVLLCRTQLQAETEKGNRGTS